MSYSVKFENGKAIINNLEHFDPKKVFDCGQCFNFNPIEDGSFLGVVGNRVIGVAKAEDGSVIISNVDPECFDGIASYLCLDDDYESICLDIIESMEKNGADTEVMKRAMELGTGIRLMRQDKWETLCSFIISQNNNIPRIKKIIATISREFGEKFTVDGVDHYSFPTPRALVDAGVDRIFQCKTGFRAKYIYDAAYKVVNKEIDLDAIDSMPTKYGEEELMRIKGVGPKVAACVLLFGYGKKDAFPIDVWVKKVLSKYYQASFLPYHMGRYAGVAQQYLFYYERYLVANQKQDN